MKSFGSKFVIAAALLGCLVGFSTNTRANTPVAGEEEYFLVTDKTAMPVGGVEGVMKKIYAETSLKGKAKGKLYLLVYVGASGDVDEVKVVKGLGGKESDVLPVVEKVKFTPGMNGSTAVKSKVALALNFE